jgi:hypothetical protein
MGRFLLLAASIAICLIVVECGLRALPDSALGFHYDPMKGRFALPREFQLNKSPNSLGFHDVEPKPRRPGVRRVLLLGDSYVESYSVPASENVGQRLQAHLNARSKTPHEVVSIGRSAWGQREELAALREYGARVEPDLVLTLFLPLNDVQNNSPELRERTKLQHLDPELMMRPGWTRRSAETMPLLFFDRSLLNQQISHRLARGLLRRRGTARADVPVDYFVYSTSLDEDWREAWEETERLLRATLDGSWELGAGYALASASTPQGVLGAEAGRELLLETYPGMRGRDWDLDQPDRLMAELAGRVGIPFVALEPSFREATARGEVLHWPYDGHWNPAGIDLAGELLAEFVLSLSLRPPQQD